MDAALKIAISFASLELLELSHGRRGLTQCPGVMEVAKVIQDAKLELESMADCERKGSPFCGALESPHSAGCVLDRGHPGAHNDWTDGRGRSWERRV